MIFGLMGRIEQLANALMRSMGEHDVRIARKFT